jgi:hypothetical protein
VVKSHKDKFQIQDQLPMSDTLAAKKDRLERVETIAKIFSLVALPFVVAVGGWQIQKQIAKNALDKEYVSLAITILREKEEPGQTRPLRTWAVDLLNAHSPIKLSATASNDLESAKVSLPFDLPYDPSYSSYNSGSARSNGAASTNSERRL